MKGRNCIATFNHDFRAPFMHIMHLCISANYADMDTIKQGREYTKYQKF